MDGVIKAVRVTDNRQYKYTYRETNYEKYKKERI